MSNIGKKAVTIKEGVTVTIDGSTLAVNGPKGKLDFKIPHGIIIEMEDGTARIKKVSESRDLEKFTGLTRAMLANMITGVSTGFEKKLELQGVGYRARMDGQNLVLNVGFAIPMTVKPLDGVSIAVVEGGIIIVSGINKQHVGDTSADIRAIRPPDPYKGKGIRYQGEVIRKKAGKAAKAAGK